MLEQLGTQIALRASKGMPTASGIERDGICIPFVLPTGGLYAERTAARWRIASIFEGNTLVVAEISSISLSVGVLSKLWWDR